MNKYPIVPLGEVCDFAYGDGLKETDRKGGDVPVYGSNGIVGWHDEALTKGETLIVGRKGSIGEVHFSKVPCWAIDTTYFIEKTKVPCDFTWLYYTLKALDLTRLNKSAAIPGLNREDAYEQKIPLPPLTEQKRIASLLARADRLRQLRWTAHDLSDALLQSVFLEMFGDVARNEKGWEKYPISKYINVQGGYSFKSGDFIKAGVKVVKITNVHYGQLTWQDDTEFLPDEYLNKYSAFSLKTGDIVMSLTRPIIKSLNSVKVCRVQETDLPCLLNQRVGRLIIKNTKKIVPEFLLHFCYSQHFKAKVDDFLSESLQPNISINQVGEIEIPVPPLSLQEEFAGVVARVESLRGRMGESTRQVEGLFESLLSQSFGGT